MALPRLKFTTLESALPLQQTQGRSALPPAKRHRAANTILSHRGAPAKGETGRPRKGQLKAPTTASQNTHKKGMTKEAKEGKNSEENGERQRDLQGEEGDRPPRSCNPWPGIPPQRKKKKEEK